MNDLDYYPKDYADAKRLWSEILPPGAQRGQWSVPGGKDSDLFVDHAFWPALQRPQTLYLMFSGVHGCESYAGHAIQAMLLRDLFARVERGSTGLFLVHALNPFGFKHHQRCTEAGVNLNRNCSANSGLYRLQNPDSLALSERFVPRRPVDSEHCELLKHIRRVGEQIFFADVSLDGFVKAAAQGQYQSKEGLEFGGHEAEPQIRALTWRLREILPPYRDVILLDLHTGLGDRGRLHLLSGDPELCLDPSLMEELLRFEEDRGLYHFTDTRTEGFYPTSGATNDLVGELVGEHQRVCALTMEYGTLGHSVAAQLDSINQWLLEHQGLLYGFSSPELEARLRKTFLERSYPAAPEWRQSVVFLARQFIAKLMARTGSLRAQ